MPEIIRPDDIQEIKGLDIYQVILSSAQELLELAETLDIEIVFQTSKKWFMFLYKDMQFVAKQ